MPPFEIEKLRKSVSSIRVPQKNLPEGSRPVSVSRHPGVELSPLASLPLNIDGWNLEGARRPQTLATAERERTPVQ